MLFFLVFFVEPLTVEAFYYSSLLSHSRPHRHCRHHRLHGIVSAAYAPAPLRAAEAPAATSSAAASAPVSSLPSFSDNNTFSLVFIFMSALLFLLIFLEVSGLVKGLIGLWCWDKVGMYGLNLLIDLPRPLAQYQEKELRRRPVVYDIGGWPVHPDTLERTVRVLPKRTEFCLNLIFFLAYPLAALVYICAFCCCIRTLTKSQENACFKHVDVVRLTKPKSCSLRKGEIPCDCKEDPKEKEDTKYVMDAMKESKESLHQINIKLKACACHHEK